VTSTQSVSRDAVMAALRTVDDPELHKDLVTLNMIKDVVIEGGTVGVTVELTTPACPLRGKIESDVRGALMQVPGVAHVELQITAQVRSMFGGKPGKEPIPGIRNTIAVASGKGGVGKSTVAVNIAASLMLEGAKVGLLDADIYGPSIPIMLGTNEAPVPTADNRLNPVHAHNMTLMSVGFINRQDDKPIIWRGPMVAGLLTQFLRQVAWGELDYLVIDLPPGTGDAQLTLTQALPLSGSVIVTQPAQVALSDAQKGINMFKQLDVPILGIIENMSYYPNPVTGEKVYIFGKGGGQRAAARYNVPLLGEIPLDPEMAESGDAGVPLVIKNAASPLSLAFRDVSRQMAARLSVESFNNPIPLGVPIILDPNAGPGNDPGQGHRPLRLGGEMV
jgi:ATP-binding protein involved in chromosome partitioning